MSEILMDFVARLPKWLILVIGVILVAIIGYIDFLTGDYSLLVFYMLPVALVAWFVGFWRGGFIAVLCGVARILADYVTFTNKRLLYWNTFEDSVFLIVVSLLIFLLRKSLKP
jgi:hypothetical protein